MLDKYNRDHGINVREMSWERDIQIRPGVLPILLMGHWDYLIHQYKPKEESLQYSTKKLFIPETNDFIPVNGDVDPREGVMSRFKRFLFYYEPRDSASHVTPLTIEEITNESG
jgi:hypothetical protein